MTPDDAHFIEQITRTQSNTWYWHKLRMGRVTGSNFRRVCRTNANNPSKSILKSICYPEKSTFFSEAVNYGKKMEPTALLNFIERMKASHINFKCKSMGLVVDVDFPFFAVSPDGCCECECCGHYLVEIKCPISIAGDNSSIENLFKLSDPFIKVVNGEYLLKTDHTYYYQIQMQMAICKLKLCHFFIWSPGLQLHIIVKFDPVFWCENSAKAYKFVKNCLIPELMNSYYTKIY